MSEQRALGSSLVVTNASAVRRYWVLAVAGVALATVVAFTGRPEVYYDCMAYRWLAEGHTELVAQPFSNRQREPLAARGLTRLLHTSTDRSFQVLAFASILVCLGGAGYILYRSGAPVKLSAATPFLPVWAYFAHGYLLPDIFYSALLTIFLLCLWRKSYWLAVGLLFPLYVSREAAVVALVALVVAGARLLRARVMAGAALATAAGAICTHLLARGGQPNPHHLPTILYLIGKVPFNFMSNVVGIPPWTNTLPLRHSLVWAYVLPRGVHLGAIKVVGICPFHVDYPFHTFLSWTGCFGVLPLVLYASLRAGMLRTIRKDLFLRFCILHGIISFVAGPLLGAGVWRLVLYGWSAFLVAVPMVWPRHLQGKGELIFLNLLSGWAAFAVMQTPGEHTLLGYSGAAIVGASWIITLIYIRGRPASDLGS